MRPAALAAVCAALLLLGPADARKRTKAPTLLQVLAPAGRANAPAHPDVNIVVRFTSSADPDTFRARLTGRDITDRFRPIIEQGKQIGVRATIPHERLKIGRRNNRLRVLMRAHQAGKGRPPRQIVRVRFRAVETTDLPPVANIVPESEVIFPTVPLRFDGTQSFDPELDELTYQWDFGEGTGSTEEAPTYTYASADEPRTVTLTVSDGQATGTATVALRSCPQPEGGTAGVIQVDADGPLEFGAVALGASATRTFTITNVANDPASHLGVCIGFEGAGFSISPERVDLGPGQSAPVTVTFAPTATGHSGAVLALVSAAQNRRLVSSVAHGYGGDAPGNGPTLGSTPLLYASPSAPNTFGSALKGIMPNGAPFALASDVGTCVASVGFSSADECVTDGDCAANGGTCQPSGQLADITEMCSDGSAVYLLSEDTFTDPAPPDTDYPLAGTLLRIGFDGSGNPTGKSILARTTEDSTHLACDEFTADAGGRVYVASTRSVPEVPDCFRDTREALLAIRKSNGAEQEVMDRIDGAQGLTSCDDIDNSTHLEVSTDGAQAFASFDAGGVWRLRPAPLQFLDSSYFEDLFRVHPDGSIVFATVRDGPTTATVSLFKVTPAQVANGPLPVNGLPPCATFQLPNNRPPTSRAGRVSGIDGLAVSPSTPGSRDGTILVYLDTPALQSMLPQTPAPAAELKARINNLSVVGTIAFSSPAGATTCTPIGLINLERITELTLTF